MISTAIAMIQIVACADAPTEEAPLPIPPATDIVETSDATPVPVWNATMPAAFAMEGLLSYYSLNGHAEDSGPMANHGNVHGAMTTSNRRDEADAALEFDGQDDYVALNARLIDDRLEHFSLSLWLRSTSPKTSGVFAEGTTNGSGLSIRMIPSKGALEVHSGGCFDMDGYPDGGGSLTDGSWHHVVIAAELGQNVQLWLDGVMVNELRTIEYSQSQPTEYPPVLGRLGHSESNNPRFYFKGAIDDVAVFDRPLTLGEIFVIYTDVPQRDGDG